MTNIIVLNNLPLPEITRQVIVQKWEETERGWGTRPDGYSLHISEEDRQVYIKNYWASMPDEVPDEYSRPDSTPYMADISLEIYEKVVSSKHGLRCFGKPPGHGGVDGWIRRA